MALGVVAVGAGVRDAAAMGLGQATVLSSLGQPLRLSIPVTLSGDEEVGCIQVRPSSDDLPSVFNVRTQVVRVGSQTRLEIMSAQTIEEPAIGFRVSVGCASPVARDVVAFLDPPVITPPGVESTSTALAPTPIRPRARPAPVRREGAGPRRSASGPGTGATAVTSERAPRRARAPIARNPRVGLSTQPALPRLVDAPKEADAAARAKAERDRLTVAPTEASKVPPLPPMATPGPTVTPASANEVKPATPVAPTSPVTPVVPDASTGSNTVVPADATADEMAAREAQLRRDQAELQDRIKLLGDQIAALRVQTTTLVTRNQELETNALAPWLVWLLIALALAGILLAGWMGFRYVQLRRSLEGSPWWGGNTVYAPDPDEPAAVPAADATTSRTASAPSASRVQRTDVRSNVAATKPLPTATSNVHGKSRPLARDPRYATSIDTDFTVSDIEAAMATVRTVSPARAPTTTDPLGTSDFASLAGNSLPSPFANPPAGKRSNIDETVDLEIPPIPPSSEDAAAHIASNDWTAPAPAPQGSPKAADETTLDFRLDLPEVAFDPLSTDSMKTTIVDRVDPAPQDAPPTSAIDFELPLSPSVAPLGDHDRTMLDSPVRHGATALNNLFDATRPMGPDTILNLDERDDSPLSSTEVDRLVTTEVGGSYDRVEGTTHARLLRFGSITQQVDEIAKSEPTRAISLLRQYVLRDESIPTLFWLLLFSLYQRVDKRAVHEALGDHFSRRYHRPAPAWGSDLVDRAPQTPLTAMPSIDKSIEDHWGTEEGLETIRALLCDRDQPDAVVFDAVLQRDLLDAVKVFPMPNAAS